MNEQITLQLGSYSNYVGSHFWNFQDEAYAFLNDSPPESISENCNFTELYRFKRNAEGSTTGNPRALIFEHRGNLGSLNPFDNHQHDSINSWSGDITVVQQDPEPKNNFLKMLDDEDNDNDDESSQNKADEDVTLNDRDVKVWSDFLKARLHPITVCEMPYHVGQRFDTYHSGLNSDVIPTEIRLEWMDKVRKLAEECDYLRTVMLLADLHDGFGGLAAFAAEYIRDDMPAISMPLFAFTENSHQSNQPVPLYSVQGSIQRCNIPLAYAAISQYASLILPVCPNAASAVSPYLHVNPLLPHHTSAVVASALETLTCSNRLIRDLGRAMTSTSDGGSSSARSAHRSWISEATFGGRVQFGQVEMTMPFDPNVVKSTLINCQMEVRVGHDSYGLVNPFASSLSSAVHGCYAPKARKLIKGPGGGEDGGGDGGIDGASSIDSRTLSNVLFTRGVFDSGRVVNESGDCAQCSVFASVSCNALVLQNHFDTVLDAWNTRRPNAQVVLERNGMGSEECEEVREKLLDLKTRHHR